MREREQRLIHDCLQQAVYGEKMGFDEAGDDSQEGLFNAAAVSKNTVGHAVFCL
jgi:hypothetical protein